MYDGLTASDNLLASLNGLYTATNMPYIQSTGPSMLIHFYSDQASVYSGFDAVWTAGM